MSKEIGFSWVDLRKRALSKKPRSRFHSIHSHIPLIHPEDVKTYKQAYSKAIQEFSRYTIKHPEYFELSRDEQYAISRQFVLEQVSKEVFHRKEEKM